MATLIFIYSCNPAPRSDDQETKQDPPSAESVPKEETLEEKSIREFKEDSICREQPFVLCNYGVGDISLGIPIRDAQPDFSKPMSSADSLDSKGGYVWVTRTFQFPKGRIFVEGEFIDERAATDTLLSNTLVNRIRIESPEFATTDGIRVGDPVSKLFSLFPAEGLVILPVPGFQVLDISHRQGIRRVHYMLNDPGYKMAKQMKDGYVPASVIPPDATFLYLVLM